MVGDEALGGDVVLVQSQALLAHMEGMHGLAGWQPLEVGDHHLDHEAALRLELGGRVAEARDLRVLRWSGS